MKKGPAAPSGVRCNPQAAAAGVEAAAEFVIRGKVQGVFFRKHTLARATELQLKGDVRNEGDGSVVGFMQGTAAAVDAMKVWLRTKGSPKSRIDSAEFTQCSARGDVLAFCIIGKD